MYNVLFVNDDKYFLEIIERKNVFKNINFVFALNAEEAINILNSKEIAVICSDLRMPETNGIDLLNHVKLNFPNIIRIVITHLKDINTLSVLIRKDEIYRYLQKPIMFEEEFYPAIKDAVHKYMIERTEDTQLSNLKKENNKLNESIFNDELKKLFVEYYNESQEIKEKVLEYLLLESPKVEEKNKILDVINQWDNSSNNLKRKVKIGIQHEKK